MQTFINPIIIKNYDQNKTYQFGCVITYKDRSDLVEATFKSINDSFIPDNLLFILINDGSTEDIIPNLKHDYILINKDKNYGVSHSLAIGWDIIYLLNIEFMLNIDSDTEVSSNWISVLNNTFQSYYNNNCVVTGYHGSFPNKVTNHPIVSETKSYRIKCSVGGINIFFHRDIYKSIIRKSLTSYNIIPSSIEEIIFCINLYGLNPKIDPRENHNGWDWGLSFLCQKNNISILCSKKSVVQHKGVNGISSNINYFEQSYDYKNECVPKIIHQLWKDKNIPEHLLRMQKSVLDHHSNYEYMFWTDSSLDQFVKDHYPGIWDFYDSGMEYVIQKIDFIRLLLVYHYGGIYLDLDSLCVKNIDNWLNYPCSLVNTRKHESFSHKHYPLIINNACISSEPRNDFIKHVILNIIDYKDPSNYKDYCSFNPLYTKILKSTGPLCITDSYSSYKNKSFINLLSNNYYYGIDVSIDMSLLERMNSRLSSPHINNYHFIHIHESSWWKINGKAVPPALNINFNIENLDNKKNMAKIELGQITS